MNSISPAPRFRPGIVVHDPSECIDGLLAEFALTLRARGFNVVGFVQQNNQSGAALGSGCQSQVEYFDLSTSDSIIVERDVTASYLRQAMGESADLLVISRFASYLEAVSGETHRGARDVPLLTSIAGRCLQKWHSFAQHEGAMVAPNIKSLWDWWGPDRLYQDLALGVDEAEVRQIVCGPRWIMVQGPQGTGLSYLPRHPKELVPHLPQLARQSLRGLAQLVQSWNPLEMAVGIAAINAHYNRSDLTGQTGNGLKSLRHIPGQVAFIGAFPGIDGMFPQRTVIEADPKPGEYPLAAMDAILPGCAAVIANSSALVNRTLPRLIRLAPNRPLALIGPSTPLTPRLHDYGIQLVGGLAVDDPNGLAAAIRAGALPREFGRFGRYLHLPAL